MVKSVSTLGWTLERLVARANEDLAGGIANLVNRIVTLVHRHRGGVVPYVDQRPIAEVAGLADRVDEALAGFDHRSGTQAIVDAVSALNRDLEGTAPWMLAKEPAQAERLDKLLVCHLRSVTEIVAALAPIIPDLAMRLQHQLGGRGTTLQPPTPGFRRIES